MKRIVLFLVTVCMIFALVSCGKTYDSSLATGEKCYIDVTEIIPRVNYGTRGDYLYCECKLKDGGTAIMEITTSAYIDNFDSTIMREPVNYGARPITYDEPIRIEGEVANSSEALKMPGKKAVGYRVFSFKKTDSELSLGKGKRDDEPVEYKESLETNVLTYVELVSITPRYVVSVNFADNSVLCECVTGDGKTIWMNVSTGDYMTEIDRNSKFGVLETEATSVKFAAPVRYLGITVKPEELIDETKDDIPELLFDYAKRESKK